jgi:hypothetical protein
MPAVIKRSEACFSTISLSNELKSTLTLSYCPETLSPLSM